jgi:hypothetical protein
MRVGTSAPTSWCQPRPFQISLRNVSPSFATRCSLALGDPVLVEACLQVTMFLEDGALMPRMPSETFRSARPLRVLQCLAMCRLFVSAGVGCGSCCSEFTSVSRVAILTWRRITPKGHRRSRDSGATQRVLAEAAGPGCTFAGATSGTCLCGIVSQATFPRPRLHRIVSSCLCVCNPPLQLVPHALIHPLNPASLRPT